MKTILSIAGSDSSAGAGIQQDLKTATAIGVYCATAITAVTAQNTFGVRSVFPIPAQTLEDQIATVLEDLDIAAIKIGMIPNLECAETIVKSLSHIKCPIVCDPVMVSTSGTSLMENCCVDYIQHNLFPLCTLVTPNIPEWERLNKCRTSVPSTSFLVKGGHATCIDMTDRLIMADGTEHCFNSVRIDSKNLHGTGCTLSTAIVAFLAKGMPLMESIFYGKQVINQGIEGGRNLNIGHGNGPLWVEHLSLEESHK